jgi:hypothetical protein
LRVLCGRGARWCLEHDRERDLIEAGLNEAAGYFGTMGIVTMARWPSMFDGSCVAGAKGYLDKDGLADLALGVSRTSI